MGKHLQLASPMRAAFAVALASILGCGYALRADSPATGASETPKAAAPDSALRGLGGHVLPALARATRIPLAASTRAGGPGPTQADEPITLTVVLNREDEAGFQKFLFDVYDPASPIFRHWLTPLEQADRFGPSAMAYDSVLRYVEAKGFHLVQGSVNRSTLTVAGTRGITRSAFGVTLDDYELSGRRFFANDHDPDLPAALAPHVKAIVGLSSLARPSSPAPLLAQQACFGITDQVKLFLCIYPYVAAGGAIGLFCGFFAEILILNAATVAGLSIFATELVMQFYPGPSCLSFLFSSPEALLKTSTPLPGAGQTIGLVEYDSYKASDVADFLALYGFPSTQINQITDVKVAGGAALGAGETEVLLDIDVVSMFAAGANVRVYEAPFSTSFQTLFSQMMDDGVSVISNSWTYCEDQTTLADVQSLDSILATAAGAGMSVLNGSGDSGSTCFDGSPSTAGVPADSPHATAVGGSSLGVGPGATRGVETWWNGHGGFGVSRFFSRPSYQNGFTSAAA
ncbi:MAG TPA: protease pro-enzyme activation domain-containing protein, partial [Thermoanaerobaculia bacterium]|nr:protease pro-enzyme activation domain-containing protein [Thermoanaerobaculia bacterium]